MNTSPKDHYFRMMFFEPSYLCRSSYISIHQAGLNSYFEPGFTVAPRDFHCPFPCAESFDLYGRQQYDTPQHDLDHVYLVVEEV